ncbi:MAG: hypothetical protein ACYCR7_01755 [Thermoplasmataceae archaeon]
MDNNKESGTIRCSNCLETNSKNDIVCKTCGNSLASQVSGSSDINYKSDSAVVSGKSKSEVSFTGDISNTITGFLLLGIGTLLLWIPYIQYLGILINLIGVILILLNKNSFESAHGTYVILSILIWILGFAVILGGVFAIASQMMSSSLSPTGLQSSFNGYLQEIVLVSITGALITSVSYVLISLGLQDETGKLLLFVGLMAFIIVEIVIGVFLYSALPAFVSKATSSGTYNPTYLSQFQSNMQFYSILSVIPDAIFGIIYLRLYAMLKNLKAQDINTA